MIHADGPSPADLYLFDSTAISSIACLTFFDLIAEMLALSPDLTVKSVSRVDCYLARLSFYRRSRHKSMYGATSTCRFINKKLHKTLSLFISFTIDIVSRLLLMLSSADLYCSCQLLLWRRITSSASFASCDRTLVEILEYFPVKTLHILWHILFPPGSLSPKTSFTRRE